MVLHDLVFNPGTFWPILRLQSDITHAGITLAVGASDQKIT